MIFLVAEIGVNWDGDFGLAEEMMRNAKVAGCNAVKFQAYQETMIKDHPARQRLVKSAITENNIEKIDRLAKSLGIEWFCTPMYPAAIDFLNPFVRRFKIRELDGRPLLENRSSKLLDKIFDTKKEVIVSCQKSPHRTEYYNNSNIKWLYCVPKYPCMIEDLDFSNIKDFDGFSNHYPHLIAPVTAAILGANIIEVHVTLNKSSNYIDNNVSLDFNDLTHMMELIRLAEKIKKGSV